MKNERSGRLDKMRPWPALLSFTEADHNFFGGREEEAATLFRAIRRDRLTLFYGLSGLGKSSLLAAGVFPLLRSAGFFPVQIRLDFSESALLLTEQVKNAITVQAPLHPVEVPPMEDDDTLWQVFHRTGSHFWGPRDQLFTPVLAFDQFEEIFTKGGIYTPRVAHFLNDMADLVTGVPRGEIEKKIENDEDSTQRLYRYRDHRYRVVFTLREDFVPQLDALSGRFPSIFNNWVRLAPMKGDAALRSALKAGGHLLDETTAKRVIYVVAGERDPKEIAASADAGIVEPPPIETLTVEPPLLSLFFSEINETRITEKKTSIDPPPLSASSRDEILMKFYNRCLEGLDDSVRNFVEDKLLSNDGKMRDYISVNRAKEVGISENTIDTLVKRWLLRIEPGKAPRVELSHDVLTSVVRASRDRRRNEQELIDARTAAAEARRLGDIARRKLLRTRIILAAVLALIAYAIIAPIVTRRSERRKEASAAYQLAMQNLQFGLGARSLAFLARAVRLDADNTAARSMLSDILLNRAWPIEVTRQTVKDTGIVDVDWGGRRLLVKAKNKRYTVTNLAGQAIFTVPVPETGQVKFSKSGNAIIVSDEKSLSVYDSATGKRLVAPVGIERHAYDDVTPDGQMVLIGVVTPLAMRTYAVTAGGLVLRRSTSIMPGGSGYQFNTRGQLLARGPFRQNRDAVWLYDFTGDRAPFPIGIDGKVQTFFFTSDERNVVLTDDTNKIYVVSVADGAVKPLSTDNEGRIAGADLDRNGRRLLIVSADGGVHIADLNGQPNSENLSLHDRSRIISAQFNADGSRILTISDDHAVRCWDAVTGRAIGESMLHEKPLRRVLFGADAANVVTVDTDRTVRVWRLSNDRKTWKLPVRSFGFMVASKSRIGIVDGLDEITAVDLQSHKTIRSFSTTNGRFLDFSRTSGLVLAQADNQRIIVWEPKTDRKTEIWPTAISPIKQGTMSADGRTVVLQFQKTEEIPIEIIQGGIHTGSIPASPDITLQVDPKGARIAVASGESLQLYNVTGTKIGRAIALRASNEWDEKPFAFDESGTLMLTLDRDDSVHLWNTVDGSQATTFKTGEKLVAAALSPDGNLIATLTDKGLEVRSWRDGVRSRQPFDVGEDNKGLRFFTNRRLLLFGENSGRPVEVDVRLNPTALGPSMPSDEQPEAVDDRKLLVFSGDLVTELEISGIRDDELKEFAELAEAIAGMQVDDHSVISVYKDAAKTLKKKAVDCNAKNSRVCQLAKMFSAGI